MLRRLILFLALPFAALSTGHAAVKRHPVQHTIQPRVAVHYYHPKPPRRSFTQQVHRRPPQAHG